MNEIETIIQKLNLKPHPREGGYFAETYHSPDNLDGISTKPDHATEKSMATAIYYLITPDSFSKLHRLPTDELFHFYKGDPVTMLHLYPDGSSKIITLGNDIEAGERPQVLVPRNVWQGSVLKDGGRYALMGTTMSPGFDFDDYQQGNRDELISQYPDQIELIERLTRE